MLSTPYIGGKAIDVPPSAFSDVVNPANQKPFAKIFMAQEQHMRAAIDAADAAKKSWASTLAAEREAILHRAADELEKARDEIVELLISEAGSTFGKAQFEVPFAANMVRSIAGEARRIHGDVFPADVPGMISMSCSVSVLRRRGARHGKALASGMVRADPDGQAGETQPLAWEIVGPSPASRVCLMSRTSFGSNRRPQCVVERLSHITKSLTRHICE